VSSARGDDVEHRRAGKPADNLDDPVGGQFGPFETVGARMTERGGRIEWPPEIPPTAYAQPTR